MADPAWYTQGKELTKKFEEVKRGPAAEILSYFQQQNPRGEFVVVI